MEDKLFETLDNLDISDTNLLLMKDIKLSVDLATKERIEKSLMKKTGLYNEKSERKNKINNIIGGIFMKKKIALALSAAVVLSLAGGGYAYAKTPVAYVSMDINPSVELGVNAFDTVVSVEGYNEDGKTILEGTDLLNTKVDEAVSTVISNAIEDGYIKEDGSSVIEITTSTDKTTGAAVELDESLKNVVDETLTNNNVQAEVETEKVALARRDEARKLGITPGKLNLIQKLQALDSTITVEDYKNSSVKDIQKKTKELRKNSGSETTTEDSTSTSTTTGISAGSVTNDTTANVSTEAATSSETTVDSNKAAILETEENNDYSNNKVNNGNSKKEENKTNSKKEEKISVNQEEKSSETAIEKQNKNDNANAQGANNSSNELKSSTVKTDSNNSNSSSSKSENSNKGNSSKSDSGSSSSNLQGKGKNK